jgi:hypothetical protein
MTVYILLGPNTTVAGSTVAPVPPVVVQPAGPQSNNQTPAQPWLHEIDIFTGSVSGSATVQTYGSNDDRVSLGVGGNGVWVANNATVSASAAASSYGSVTVAGTATWKYHGAVLVSLTGAGASVTDRLSC